ncbi:MAG: PD-(D/E)XK nuclease family protein, partial [Bacteroidota bacterium]
ILMELEKCVVERFGMEKEYLYHFKQVIHQLYTLLDQQQMIVELSTFRNLFKKIAGSLKIPFSGEPVEGLQVMGVLETRNLDFKYVFMLNMNESVFPASNRKGSFVPYRIRKAFGMPTFSAQDAIYAYLFYRLFHTGEVFHCYYNTYADFGLSGEVSRFIRQLSHETNIPIHKRKLSNPIMLREVKEISIETTEAVIQKLMIYTDQVPEKQQRRLSASALNAYIDCPLKFYFRYVLRLFSEDEISQELDARHFGNVLHGTMEILYRDNMAEKGAKTIDENDFFRLENSVTGAIEKAFRKEFGMKENHRFEFKDRNVVMSEVIKSFADRILQLDKAYAPFQIISLEEDDKYQRFVPIQTKARNIGVKLGAAIDRVDKKGDEVRILDYKTGRDETDIGRFEHLFGGEMTAKHQKARKAGYQTFFYAWLYVSKMGGDGPIIPGLINMKQVFQPDFDYRLIMDGKPLNDVSGYLAVFEEKLKVLLQEIFDPQIPFARREHSKQCAYCEYQSICEG